MDSRPPSNNPRRTFVHRRNQPFLWDELSYAGEKRVPIPLDPTAGSFPLFFLGRNEQGDFTDPAGNPIAFEIRSPFLIDFEGEQLPLVRQALRDLTPSQVTIAEYWGAGPATKQWTPIIDRLIDTYHLTPVRAARVLAAVQSAINDTFAVVWFLKYQWLIPRPNQLDQTLRTIICTPKFPSYPSGHAAISGTAEVVLSYFFPPEADRLRELAEENGMSRIYGGVHYPVDHTEGMRLGRQIGRMIVGLLSSQRDGDMVRVDDLIVEGRDAELPSPPYRQVIPFPRGRGCSSLLDSRQDPEARS